MARGLKKIPHTQNFSVVAACAYFAFSHSITHQEMNRTTTNQAPQTPPEDREGHGHYFTPARAKVRGAVQFCERMGIEYFKGDVFRTFNVSHRQGYEFLRNNLSSRRFHNNPEQEETRGRHRLISAEKLREMERILQEEGIEARTITWEQLGYEVGLECTEQTIKNAMGCMNYRKYIACKKGWVNEKIARDRKAWAQVMKERYPKPEDWCRVRFSDEVHFGYDPQGKLRIIRKLGERYCPDCIQEEKEPEEKYKKTPSLLGCGLPRFQI